jgi:hypothetical protein
LIGADEVHRVTDQAIILDCCDAHSISEMGQNPKLPHRNSNGRFTSKNGHCVGELPALPT